MSVLTHSIAFLLGLCVIPMMFHYGPDPVVDLIAQYFTKQSGE